MTNVGFSSREEITWGCYSITATDRNSINEALLPYHIRFRAILYIDPNKNKMFMKFIETIVQDERQFINFKCPNHMCCIDVNRSTRGNQTLFPSTSQNLYLLLNNKY